ncbi:FeoB-associated Cys-rich membrane protein [Clostridium sp. AM58-1XD]|uniref:FeoB-associated Cys-rich membrane protein n=1 Tax=Clostridium sp. AM58-1XD TaxID=2292307 RepID=UPI000E52ADB0|nr:FeoB-associated Cys-rich membrane protein [Clostridium sp. AM58-1XD]RGY98863.1 FeoB-associated Cys-rich membrane protein [Clostridium sp. AM58-1XD]
MQIIDLLLLLCVAFAAGLAARKIYRDKKSGRSCCQGGCQGCTHRNSCGSKKEERTE